MVSSHIRRPHDEMGKAKSQSLLWVAWELIISLYQGRYTVIPDCRPVTGDARGIPWGSSSRTLVVRAWSVVWGTPTCPGFLDSATPDEQFDRIRVWSSDILAAEANKAKRAIEEARLAGFTEGRQGRSYKLPRYPLGEGRRGCLEKDDHHRVFIWGCVKV